MKVARANFAYLALRVSFAEQLEASVDVKFAK